MANYTEIEAKYMHAFNCLKDTKAQLKDRLDAINGVKGTLINEQNKPLLKELCIKHLWKILIERIADPLEKIRNGALDCIEKLWTLIGIDEETKDVAYVIMQRITVENSEEYRIRMIQTMQIIITKRPNTFLNSFIEFAAFISNALKDTNPEMKAGLSSFILLACQTYSSHIGHYMKNVVDTLFKNIVHQRSGVRLATLSSICQVIKLDGATHLLYDKLTVFGKTAYDKMPSIRIRFYEVINEWLNSFDINDLKKYESNFTQYLLNGVSDEDEKISYRCAEILNEYGIKLQKVLTDIKDEAANLDICTFDKKPNIRHLQL